MNEKCIDIENGIECAARRSSSFRLRYDNTTLTRTCTGLTNMEADIEYQAHSGHSGHSGHQY